jgi:hypothetical protein
MLFNNIIGLLPASCLFLFDLLFDPKDGSDMFLRNVGWLQPEDTVYSNCYFG